MGGVLLESIESTSEREVKVLCETLFSSVFGGHRDGWVESENKEGGAKLLDAPVQLATKLKINGKLIGHPLTT